MMIISLLVRNLYALIFTCLITAILLCDNVESRTIMDDDWDDGNQILWVVSYDAFRTDYLRANLTPNLLEFREKGVYTDYMKNVFPTKTFTNHFSMATGVYPETHGVTANELFDLRTQKYLKYSSELFHYNPNIMPIWTLNELNGGKSGCMMWPGSDFEYFKKNCTYLQSYNDSIPLEERVDTVISWLKNDVNHQPNLVVMYVEVPDKLAHAYGPESPKVTEVVRKLDLLTKYIQDKLKENDLLGRTNVIHLSDHGMQGVREKNFIDLRKFLEPNTFKMYGTSPILQIVPEDSSKEEEIYTRLKNAAIDNGNFNVYKNSNLPKRWHCRNKDRLGPIVAVADNEYAFQDMYEAASYYQKKYNITFTPNTYYGVHGYDNELEIMRPIFMAKGPLFRERAKIPTFNNVDLYNLFYEMLKMKLNPPKTDGVLDNVKFLLRKYEKGFPLLRENEIKTNKSSHLQSNGLLLLLAATSLIVFGIFMMKGGKICSLSSQYRPFR